MKREINTHLGVTRYFASEDGKHYRGFTEDHAPIKRHVAELNELVNEAPSRGNPNGWRYAGSIPQTQLVEWLWKTRTPFHVWARNEGGALDKFMRWLRTEHPQLFPKLHAHARPSVQVPLSFRKRALPGATDASTG